MEPIERMRIKLMMLAQLPQPEYPAVARTILEELKLIDNGMGEYMEKLRQDNDQKFIDMLERGIKSPIFYQFGETEYEVIVKSAPKKPKK